MNKENLIKQLGLTPLNPEGGFVKEMYRGEEKNKRASYGTILYMLTNDTCSRMHRLCDDEIWYYHDGPSLEMLLIYDDHSEIKILGKDFSKGECPQILVPGGVWQGARMKTEGEYSLVSTSMVPAYCDEEFELGSFDVLKSKTEYLDLLKELT